MKASELISILQTAVTEHGDLDVYSGQRMEGTPRIVGVIYDDGSPGTRFRDVPEPHFELEER